MMRRIVMATVAVATGILFISPVEAGPPIDKVNGTGQVEYSPGRVAQVHVNAKSGPSGENPQGHADLLDISAGVHATGSVVCLFVDGNVARIGVRTNEPFFDHDGMMIVIEDNGAPGAGADRRSLFLSGTPEEDCRNEASAVDVIDVGNYTVMDG